MPLYSPAIEKLQKKLEKEPNSLIFLQLAEEFRKEGYYEDALNTCREGLKRHPNYWSARVAMGRIFYETADYEQAREELEKVIKAVPDNLLANKLLGDIYLHTQRPEDSLKRYQIVQMLTPNDQDVVNNIRKIEASLSQKQGNKSSAAEAPEKQKKDSPASTVEIPAFYQTHIANKQVNPELQNQMTIDAATAAAGNASATELPETLEKTSPAMVFQSESVFSEQDVTPQAASLDFLPLRNNDQPPFPETSIDSRVEDSVTESDNRPAKREDQTQPMDEKDEEAVEYQADELTTQTLAELYVQQGLTDKAIKVYQKLLLSDPSNSQIMNRLMELNPADSLLSVSHDGKPAKSGNSKAPEEPADVLAAGAGDQVSEERRRKISTLENWLATIRRERS